MAAGAPQGGPEGGRASQISPSSPSEGALAAQNTLFDAHETSEGASEASAAQADGGDGGSRAGGGGEQGDGAGCSEGWAAADSEAAPAAEHLAALQLADDGACDSSGEAGHAGVERAAAGGGGSMAGDGDQECEASDCEEADEEEQDSGTIKAHGGPTSAPRLGASTSGAAKARLSAQPSAASTASRASKRLTFSAPPKCLLSRPRLAPRANFSHSGQRVRQILRDNATLVKRLGAIAFKQPEHELSQQQHDQFMANVAASSEARRAQEARKVMGQNLAIYKRLQEVKPSRDMARASLDRDFAKHERMLTTLAALRRRSRATSQPGDGGSRKGTQSGGGQRASASPSQRASVSAAAPQDAE
ncbi:cilia- and flagella-associated 97 [Chlorella sorokiniana]|uniref:Cilia-and flagella-associated 97 n=1 Tax=Chlorella sorokiniana TaxID=3076 RepID=A0A2P6TBK8_CHLSO|nr:cilia- and flagella-associated 97 [Chlorella sorokiniana]|eukprot:PRW05939.1 cilia- and flagella-associated 97 [Chlorella sorokiniana]